jgi:hypothetical protein
MYRLNLVVDELFDPYHSAFPPLVSYPQEYSKPRPGNALPQCEQATQGDSPSAAFVEARQPFAVRRVLRAHGSSICSLLRSHLTRVWM